MNKPFLLIAGQYYYPAGGTCNWIDRFKTKEQALLEVQDIQEDLLSCNIKGRDYEWFEIVNLETWDAKDERRVLGYPSYNGY